LLGILVVLASIGFVHAVSTYQRIIASRGTIKSVNVGVYWDVNCTNAISSIDWGMLEPGATRNTTVYLKNEGNAPITLFLNLSNWNPAETEGFIDLSWNYDGQNLQPEKVLLLTLTLTVAENITGITSFSFDIVIIGEG